MAGAKLATYYVAVVPTTAGIQGQLAKELTPEVRKAAGLAGRAGGESLGKAMSTGIRGTMQAVRALGSELRTALTPAIAAAMKIGGHFKAAGSHAVNFGKAIVSSIGNGARQALDMAAQPFRNFVAGFRSAEAAVSKATGFMGTFGGATRRAWDTAARGAAGFVNGLKATGGAIGRVSSQAASMASGVIGAFRNFGSSVSSAFAGVSEKVAETRNSLAQITGVAMATGGAIAAMVGGIALKGGIDRALNIEDAQAKLRGLGHDTGTVDGIMKNALASVKGTAFGLDEAATTAAMAVAAGIEPGERLEEVLGTVANSASASGSSMSEMGAVFGEVMATNKAYNGSLQQLANRGIPIYQALADEIGVTTEEVTKMASKGQIDFDTFERAANKAVGNVATEMGKTTRGQIKNFFAALSRMGAAVVTPLLPVFKGLIQWGTDLADAVTGKITPALETASKIVGLFVKSFSGAEAYVEFRKAMEEMGISTSHGFGAALVDARAAILAFVNAFNATDSVVTSSGLAGTFEKIGFAVRDGLGKMREIIASIPTPVLIGLGSAFAFIAGKLAWMAVVAGPIGAIFGKIMAVIGPLIPTLGGLVRIVMALFSPWALVIGLFVTAIAHSQELRGKIGGLWESIKDFFTTVAEGLAPVLKDLAGNILPVVRDVFASLVGVAGAVIEVVVDIGKAFLDALAPILVDIGSSLLPAFGAAFKVIGWVIANVVLPGLMILVKILGAVLVPAIKVAGFILGLVFKAIRWAIERLVDFWVNTAWPNLEKGFQVIGAVAMWLWENALKPAWEGVKDLIGGVVDWFVNTGGPGMWGALQNLGGFFSWLWNDIIKPAWGGISDLISWAWSNIIKPVFDGIAWAINNLGLVMRWVYDAVIKPVWDGIRIVIAFAGAIIMAVFDGIKWAIKMVADGFMWWWHSVIVPVWNGVSNTVKWAWSNIILPVFNAIKWFIGGPLTMAFNWIRGVAQTVWNAIKWAIYWAWHNVIKPTLHALVGFYNNVLVPVFNWIKGVAQTVWNAIKWAIYWAWHNVIKPTLNALNAFIIGPLSTAFRWLRDTVRNVWNAIRNAISWTWVWIRDNVFRPLWNFLIVTLGGAFRRFYDNYVRPVWNSVRDKISGTWHFIRDRIFNPLKKAVREDLPNAFNFAKDKIGEYWDKIKAKVKAPIKWVLKTIINDGVVKHFNNIAGKLGVDTRLPKVDLKGWSSGGYTGRGGKYEPAGVVHRDEFVIRKESRREIEAKAPGFMDRLNRYGARALEKAGAGYANGGRVRPLRGGVISSGYGPRGGGFHDGIDFAAPMGTPVYAAEAGTVTRAGWSNYGGGNQVEIRHAGNLVTWYAHMSSILTKVGKQVKAGDRVGSVGSTGNSTGPHLHFAVYQGNWPNHRNPSSFLGGALKGDGSGGGGGSFFDWATEAFKKAIPIEKLIDKIPGKGIGKDIAKGVGRKLFDSAVDKIGELFGASSDDGSNGPGPGAGGGADRWRPTVEKALRMTGDYSAANVNSAIRRMNQESSGNPRAINNWDSNARRGTPSKGLMQVIDPTFRAYAHPGYAKDIWDPLSNILASIRYTKARYGSVQAGWNRAGGYADGGRVKPVSLFDGGGWLRKTTDPMLIQHKMSKPDAVLTNDQWSNVEAILDAVQNGGAGDKHLHIHGAQFDEDRLVRRGVEEMVFEFEKAGW